MVIDRSALSPSAPSASVHAFALDLLPQETRLLLDTQTNAAILLHLPGLENTELAATHASFQLTPASTRVFEALLTAYPAYCPYRALFTALYPLGQEQEADRTWDRELALRPIRRALVTLLPALRGLGLQVVALRGQGYVLATVEADVQR